MSEPSLCLSGKGCRVHRGQDQAGGCTKPSKNIPDGQPACLQADFCRSAPQYPKGQDGMRLQQGMGLFHKAM